MSNWYTEFVIISLFHPCQFAKCALFLNSLGTCPPLTAPPPQLLGGHHAPRVLNMSHHIYELSFGPHFPGLVNPLDGFERIVTQSTGFQAFNYFIKVRVGGHKVGGGPLW